MLWISWEIDKLFYNNLLDKIVFIVQNSLGFRTLRTYFAFAAFIFCQNQNIFNSESSSWEKNGCKRVLDTYKRAKGLSIGLDWQTRVYLHIGGGVEGSSKRKWILKWERPRLYRYNPIMIPPIKLQAGVIILNKI